MSLKLDVPGHGSDIDEPAFSADCTRPPTVTEPNDQGALPPPVAASTHPVNVTVTASLASAVAVSVRGGFCELSTMFQVSPVCGSPTVLPSAPQPSAVEKLTGVKAGSAELGRPPSG